MRCLTRHREADRYGTENLGETNDLAMTTEMEMHDTKTNTTIIKKNSSTYLDTQRNVVDCDKDGEKGRRRDDEEATDLDGATRRNSLSGTVELGGPATPKALEAGIANQVEEEVIVVDWDGPDDPLNPKKCV